MPAMSMETREYEATIYMASNTYHHLTLWARNIAEAAREAMSHAIDANEFWRVVKIVEVSRDTENAPLSVLEMTVDTT